MGKEDPRVDAYIARSAPFAQPILRHLRAVVHGACPEVEETIKWSAPTFVYKGILCGMAAFKEHCGFHIWKGSLIVERDGRTLDQAMGQFGRLTTLADLPPKRVLLGYVKTAMALRDAGVKSPTRLPKQRKPAPRVPADLAAALAKNAKARTTFQGFSGSHKREYVEWITEAKGDDTRARRLATAVEWMADGKPHNWKYMKR